MTLFRHILFGAVALVGVATPALADTRAYNVGANATREIAITATDDFYMKVVGGENTDLDFRLVSPTGQTVCDDDDTTSWTECEVSVARPGIYRLYIENVDGESNAATLTLR